MFCVLFVYICLSTTRLSTVVSHHMGAGNWTQSSEKAVSALNHCAVSSPVIQTSLTCRYWTPVCICKTVFLPLLSSSGCTKWAALPLLPFQCWDFWVCSHGQFSHTWESNLHTQCCVNTILFLTLFYFLPLKWKSFCLAGHRVLVSGLRVEKRESWGCSTYNVYLHNLKIKGGSFLTLLNSLTTLSDLHMAILCIWTPNTHGVVSELFLVLIHFLFLRQ